MAKLTPARPPDFPIAANCRSVRLRECGLMAWALECVATSGASLISATSQKPRSFRCDRSSKIRNRLQAPTRALPRSVRPGPVSGDDGQRNGTPWPNAFGRLHTGPSERSPAAYSTSSSSKFASIASAPSICSTAASASSARQRSISATCPANANAPGRFPLDPQQQRRHGEHDPLRLRHIDRRRRRIVADELPLSCGRRFAVGRGSFRFGRRHEDREQAAGKSALLRFGKIQMALLLALAGTPPPRPRRRADAAAAARRCGRRRSECAWERSPLVVLRFTKSSTAG